MKYDQIDTLQGTNISHLGKRDIIFKHALEKGHVTSQETTASSRTKVISRRSSRINHHFSMMRSKLCWQVEILYPDFRPLSTAAFGRKQASHISPRNKRCLTFCFKDSILSKNHFPQENHKKRNEPFGIRGTSICKGQYKMSRLPATYNLTCYQCSTDYSGSGKRWYGLYNPLEGNTYLLYNRYILPIRWLYTTYHPLQEPQKPIEMWDGFLQLNYPSQWSSHWELKLLKKYVKHILQKSILSVACQYENQTFQ